MALSAIGSPLVAGSATTGDEMQTKTIRATRAFYHRGKLIKIGDVIDMPMVLALEMRAANKGEIIEAIKKPDLAPVPQAKESMTEKVAERVSIETGGKRNAK